MIWASIKTSAFVGLAVATGVVCTSVPVGGKTIAARIGELSASSPPTRKGASDSPPRAHREVEEAPAPGASPPVGIPPKPGKIDPRAVATVIPDESAGDSIRSAERDAISHLIEQKARAAKSPKRP